MSIIPTNNRRRLPPSGEIWEPFEFMNSFLNFPSPISLFLSHQFPSLSREAFPSFSSSRVETQLSWTETQTAHVFKAYLPGTTQEEAIVFVDDEGFLHISIEDNKIMSRFKLPDNALVEQVTSWMEDEYLVVFVPKDGSSSSPSQPENRNVRVVEIAGDDE